MKALAEFLDILLPGDFTFELTVKLNTTLINACFVAKFTKIKHSLKAEYNLTVQMPILPVDTLHIHGSTQLDLNIANFPEVPGFAPPRYRDPQGNVYTATDDGWDVDGGECSCDTTTSPD